MKMPYLTPRERQVLDLLLLGQSDPAIARQLGVSVSTVRHFVGRLDGKITDDIPGNPRHRVTLFYDRRRSARAPVTPNS